MKLPIYVLIFFSACMPSNDRTVETIKPIDYNAIIEEYLDTKTIEPTVVFNNNGHNEFDFLGLEISWQKLKKGIEINVDGHSIKTFDKTTSNTVWNAGVDSVNFANFLSQVKIYESDSIIGFVLTSTPCSGLACSVNYQMIYDLRTKKTTFFGRFRTGFEFELYNFNSDNRPDYLSKTFSGRNETGVDTTKFVLYSRMEDGEFREFTAKNGLKYTFMHSYTEFHKDLNNEYFEENWIEKINQSNNNYKH